jgi:hypothetical protein
MKQESINILNQCLSDNDGSFDALKPGSSIHESIVKSLIGEGIKFDGLKLVSSMKRVNDTLIIEQFFELR